MQRTVREFLAIMMIDIKSITDRILPMLCLNCYYNMSNLNQGKWNIS